MGWKQPDSVCRTFQFLETAVGYFFHGILKNTIIYCVGTVPLTMVVSLALAIVLNQKVKGRGFLERYRSSRM